MASMDEQILRAAKEIVVKFIENGRISPTGFTETFRNVYKTVDETVRGSRPEPDKAGEKAEQGKNDGLT